jgi:muramoyltetrapeptide carboxypeptidase
MSVRSPDRVHLIAHAGPPQADIARFGFTDAGQYIAFIRRQLPAPLRLTCARRFFEVEEDEPHGGRADDDARVRDLQAALNDPRTLAIVAAKGGAYFARILPHLDFSALARRRTPLWALGFSEMTTLVNVVASYRGGRGLYWLCPNYLAWRIRPARQAREAFAQFWRVLPALLRGQVPPEAEHLRLSPIRGELVLGKARSEAIQVIGGCLSVLAAALTGPPMRRVRPDGRWLLIEDINEMPYRIDRHLAALKIAGWFDRISGVLVGDFHMNRNVAADPRVGRQPDNQVRSVVEILKLHLPRGRRLPVVTTRSVGHVWPMLPVPINAPLRMSLARRTVTIANQRDKVTK